MYLLHFISYSFFSFTVYIPSELSKSDLLYISKIKICYEYENYDNIWILYNILKSYRYQNDRVEHFCNGCVFEAYKLFGKEGKHRLMNSYNIE